MRIRIGFGLGTRTLANDERFGPLVDTLEEARFDSLWLSERITGDAPDPVVGMAFAAGRTKKLKFGMSVMVLPGRNPVLVAKQMASLDRLSGGRLLPAFGLGVADPREQGAFGVERKQRAKMFDEALPLMRRLWTEDDVSHEGDHYHLDAVTVRPRPTQQPLEVWLGGIAASEMKRCGRLGDGWLPSFCTPDDVRQGRKLIEETAAAHSRAIDDDHFGALVVYADGEIPDLVGAFVKQRRPDLDPSDVVVPSIADVPARLDAFVEAGASKFVVLPVTEPADWVDHVGEAADVILPLQA